ncbi:Photosystem ii s4 domain [Thalictrum thalictroides]|uniref:Photosystem ii s4 domain n=1 Tax=Thalictrum thalictroides TaxID=46969 RepID=A0A7J6VWW7_THATH|nr:Photosystem ii s4 domain [Thalictrum thalictroides]
MPGPGLNHLFQVGMYQGNAIFTSSVITKAGDITSNTIEHTANFGWGKPSFVGPATFFYGGLVYLMPSPTVEGDVLIAFSLEISVCLVSLHAIISAISLHLLPSARAHFSVAAVKLDHLKILEPGSNLLTCSLYLDPHNGYYQSMAVATASFAVPLLLLSRRVGAILLPRIGSLNNNRILHTHFLPLTTPPNLSSVAGICHVVHALRRDADDVLLKGVGDKNAVDSVKHILEMARRASLRREILHTEFLTPPILKESMLVLGKLADVKAVSQGGYPQAERCRLSVGHSEAMTSVPDIVAALSIAGNFGFQPCSHGDFLGSILGTGIAREKLGDILLQGEKGAHILVVPELVDFLISSLNKVGNVSVSCTKIPLLALEYEPPRTKSFKTIEASLRVDAIASAGFKISRSKLVDLISSGDVRVNWTTVTKNGTTLKSEDIVSVSGKGRLKIGEIKTTKKGKFAVELIQYL